MATKRNHLRAAGENEKPPPAKDIKSVLDAAEHGSRLDELIQMRRVIARALDNENTSPRDLAALSRRQIEISREIEALKRQQSEEAESSDAAEDDEWSEEAI